MRTVHTRACCASLAAESSSTYYKGETEYGPGTRYRGRLFVNEAAMDSWYGAVRAFHSVAAEKVWEHKLFRPVWAGLLATAGGLVFAGGSDGFFKALDSESGEELWQFNIGASILASQMTYEVNGRQLVAVAPGGVPSLFALPLHPTVVR